MVCVCVGGYPTWDLCVHENIKCVVVCYDCVFEQMCKSVELSCVLRVNHQL